MSFSLPGLSARRPGRTRFYKQAHYSGHRYKKENRVNEYQIRANVAVAATEPTLLDRELVQRVQEPHDARSDRQSAVHPATEGDQQQTDCRGEQRIFDEDRHHSKKPSHHESPNPDQAELTFGMSTSGTAATQAYWRKCRDSPQAAACDSDT